ncbi:hypothetical protein [Rheinheimera aquimaris]|uniref:hypothetical protein n=1 Tax=Rheinheimera aquimaris TaxID=412437 RepID=UPI001064AD33|nr:hypothetical protein [Rheinheimera aquimaris]
MDLSVSYVEGTMLESSKHSKTDVYSTGRGTRHDPLRVHSVNTTVQEFWLKKLDGTEHKISLHNKEVQAREGHRLVMLLGESDDKEGYVGYVNFDTERSILFDNTGIARSFASSGWPYILCLLLAFILTVLAGLREGFLIAVLALMLGIIFATFIRNIHGFFIKLTLNRLAKEAARAAFQDSAFVTGQGAPVDTGSVSDAMGSAS